MGITFNAVILAGGNSTRMGRDKAMLEVDGQPLLARQIQRARDAGAQEIFISGRAEADYRAFGCTVLKDRIHNVGPLAGIEAALAATNAPLLLVLAVDMPRMTVDLLRRLASNCSANLGVVPRVNGAIEPLAAFYPKAAFEVLTQLLPSLVAPALAGPASVVDNSRDRLKPELQTGRIHSGKNFSAKSFAERCAVRGLVQFVELPATDAPCFANWNSPADLPCTT